MDQIKRTFHDDPNVQAMITRIAEVRTILSTSLRWSLMSTNRTDHEALWV